jgi:copper transport protein
VIFKFNESIGGTLGAVRVYDAHGREVDDLHVYHPRRRQSWIGVGLKPRLPAGTYTATYRVTSADTHVVFGGLVFNIVRASAATVTVAGLIGHEQTGEVTKLAFGLVRALNYISIALMLGGLAFLFLAWGPGLRSVAQPHEEWRRAERAFARRLHRLLLAAVVLGALASVLGLLLQGASVAGVSLWASLKGTVLSDTLHSRFGIVWAARAVVWIAIGGVLALARTLLASPPRWVSAPLILGGAYLALTPALAGHASVQSPRGVLFPSDVLHVLAASIWVGGMACLLLALPRATRRLAGPERTRLLLATLARFSPLALAAVVAIAATGVLQAYLDVRSLHSLLSNTYGALLLTKTGLLIALISLGWLNRARILPALRALAEAHRAPGGVGMLARRLIRGELALMLAVLGVTAALVGYTPPIDAEAGPFSASAPLGSAELEITVEPARAGPNTIHLYLLDARTGTPFAASKELTASASLPAKQIGPLPLKATPAGPGHYVFNAAVLSPRGDWRIAITDRVSEFEEHRRTVEVPIG